MIFDRSHHRNWLVDEHPLFLIDPMLIGSPIEVLLRSPIDEHSGLSFASPLDAADLELARRHRVSTFIRTEWVSPELQESHQEELQQLSMSYLRMSFELERLLAAFEEEGIESRVLKGLATAALDYPDDVLRQTGDIDLLVRPEQIEAAAALLTRQGCADNPRGLAMDPRLIKGQMMILPSGVEVDLHTRLTQYANHNIEALMSGSEPLPGGRGVALLAEDRLMHAAAHLMFSAYGTRRVSGLFDVMQLLPKVHAPRNPDGLGNGLEGLASHTFGVAAQLRGAAPDPGGENRSASILERRAFLRGRRSVYDEHVLVLAHTHGLARRLEYVRGFALPSRAKLQRRGGARAYYVRRRR